jgi:Flp pilus assembly protein TadD
VEDFNAALNVNNRNTAAWTGLGTAYEKLGERAKAAEAYQRALTVDPNDAAAKAGAARVGRA